MRFECCLIFWSGIQKSIQHFRFYRLTKTIGCDCFCLTILYGPYQLGHMSDKIFNFCLRILKASWSSTNFFLKIGSIRRNTQSICLLTQPSESPATNETKFIKFSIINIFIVCFINFLVSWINAFFVFDLYTWGI